MTLYANLSRLVISVLILAILSMGAARLAWPAEDGTLPQLPAKKSNLLSENMLYGLGLAHGALGNFEASRDYFSRIRESNPSSPLAYSPVALTHLAEGQLDLALYWMSEAQAGDPGHLEYSGWMLLLYDSLEARNSSAQWSQWLSNRITNQSMPIAAQASHQYLAGNFDLALQYSNLALKLDLPRRWSSDAIFMRIKRDEALADGDPEKGIRVFSDRHRELFLEKPEITPENITQATDLALLLKISGQLNGARRLLDAVLAAYKQPFVAGGLLRAELMPVRAEALAILGDQAESLAELRRVIDTGWRVYWRLKTDLNPNFNGIRHSAEFQAMVEELETDMARQRSRLQDLAVKGVFDPAPPPNAVL
jgi:tetratricopeptide (TPR) repeat protein